MAKRLPVTKTNYSLEIRYKFSNGETSEWKDCGRGYFESMEIVKKQMRIIASGYKSKHREIRFVLDGMNRDINGLLSKKNIFVDW
jgi:hypothetical protein